MACDRRQPGVSGPPSPHGSPGEGATVAVAARSLDEAAQGNMPGTLRQTAAEIEALSGKAALYHVDPSPPRSRGPNWSNGWPPIWGRSTSQSTTPAARSSGPTDITEKRLRLITTINYCPI